MGTMYDNVLPLPVRDPPRISRPAKAWGITHLWISVILWKFLFLSPVIVFCEIGKSLKFSLYFLRNSSSPMVCFSCIIEGSLVSKRYCPGLGVSSAIFLSNLSTSAKWSFLFAIGFNNKIWWNLMEWIIEYNSSDYNLYYWFWELNLPIID